MLRPQKMKYIELTVLKNDMDAVLSYLGRRGVVHFPELNTANENAAATRIRKIIERLSLCADFLGINLKNNEEAPDDNFSIPGEKEEGIASVLCSKIENVKDNLLKTQKERQRINETYTEASAFSKLNVPFAELDQLSYLTLRIGRLDPKGRSILKESLGDRAVIIPLDTDGADKILAASSRKGRFTLDTQLKKVSFEPVMIPENQKGIPSEMLKSLEEERARIEEEISKIEAEKEALSVNEKQVLLELVSLWNIALEIEKIKSGFTVTESLYHFSGWTPADLAIEISKGLLEITKGKAAIKTYSPDEVQSVKDGSEKVPVYVKHGSFVKGFESVVFSYGAPMYGTIDPTPLVAVFFTLLFGIMFGDVGHGFTLFFLGLMIKLASKKFARFSKFGTPLVSIGISSMIFGLVFGAVFTNERILINPARALTGAVTGNPVDRLVPIMPLEETGGSLMKLFYFFGFTVAIGAILISIGLVINIINRCSLKKYEEAFFSKTGLSGLLMFWYAIFIAVRILSGSSFAMYDIAGLLIPVLCIFFGPVIWRIMARKKPVLEHGLMTFIMEGFVEVLETVSTYVSNTVSFLRVGAFALSHSVLSFIVFTLAELLAHSGTGGTVGAVFVLIIGNAIIIVLEGMIVAIQVMRLQYYEFFNKFFVETGVEFSPFRIHTRKQG